MDDATFLVLLLLVGTGAAFGVGYRIGRVDQRNLLSEQLKIANWQRDEAIAQRDFAFQQVTELTTEIERTCQQVHTLWNS